MPLRIVLATSLSAKSDVHSTPLDAKKMGVRNERMRPNFIFSSRLQGWQRLSRFWSRLLYILSYGYMALRPPKGGCRSSHVPFLRKQQVQPNFPPCPAMRGRNRMHQRRWRDDSTTVMPLMHDSPRKTWKMEFSKHRAPHNLHVASHAPIRARADDPTEQKSFREKLLVRSRLKMPVHAVPGQCFQILLWREMLMSNASACARFYTAHKVDA
jgi:hypothetical protein